MGTAVKVWVRNVDVANNRISVQRKPVEEGAPRFTGGGARRSNDSWGGGPSESAGPSDRSSGRPRTARGGALPPLTQLLLAPPKHK